MALDGYASLQEVRQAYDDNADYDLVGSTSKAAEFIKACRLLVRRTPQRARHGTLGGGEEIEIDTTQVRRELEKAEAWLAAQPAAGGTSGVRYGNCNDFGR